MSFKIPLYCYLAYNNPEGCVAVIKDFGYHVLNVKSRSDVAEIIRQFISREKEDGLKALAKVHPDRQLILDNAGTPETKLGADGTSDIETIANTGVSSPSVTPSVKSDTSYTPLLIGCCLVASSLFLSAAIIAAKKN
jgi:hypothetical protein